VLGRLIPLKLLQVLTPMDRLFGHLAVKLGRSAEDLATEGLRYLLDVALRVGLPDPPIARSGGGEAG
jgi:hypothetical protein